MSVHDRGSRLQELRDRIDKEFELYGEKVRQQQYEYALEEFNASDDVKYVRFKKVLVKSMLFLFTVTWSSIVLHCAAFGDILFDYMHHRTTRRRWCCR